MSTLIINANIVNEGTITQGDLLIRNDRIEVIASDLSSRSADSVVDAKGSFLLPGLIDDQVHFREPGLTHKATIFSESRAAVAGGVTSFMEMPNTVPNTLTHELLEEKYGIASKDSLANYSFYMGASNDNIAEVVKTDPSKVCGIKVFMGSSTGNMLVDDDTSLRSIFSQAPTLVATHCEDEATIRKNIAKYERQYGEDIPMECHPLIRSEDACYKSSSHAIDLAKEYGSRLHILHISTAVETELFDNSVPLIQKRITAEACIHHLWFTDSDYADKGSRIKWNPAIKTLKDRETLRKAVKTNLIDVIATDHAPHTLYEKDNPYTKSPSGGPLVQHQLPALMDLFHEGVFTLEQIVEKACHNPAILFRIVDRGFIREGYFADLVLVDPNSPWLVSKDNILAKCRWSPFERHTFKSQVLNTWVSGKIAYSKGSIIEHQGAGRLTFEV